MSQDIEAADAHLNTEEEEDQDIRGRHRGLNVPVVAPIISFPVSEGHINRGRRTRSTEEGEVAEEIHQNHQNYLQPPSRSLSPRTRTRSIPNVSSSQPIVQYQTYLRPPGSFIGGGPRQADGENPSRIVAKQQKTKESRPIFHSVNFQNPSSRAARFTMADHDHLSPPSTSPRSPQGDAPIAIDIEPASSDSRENSDNASEVSSLSSQMFSNLRQRGRRLTASTNYQNPEKEIGAEPGVDLRQEIDLDLYAECGITIVDFNREEMIVTECDNNTLPEFLRTERPAWSTVRWINVNGLSFDVIKTLGQYKTLHRLAIEDLLNTHQRPKCDWYSDHTCVILTLQKLVNIYQAVGKDELKKRRSFWARVASWWKRKDVDLDDEECEDILREGAGENNLMKSLQRYHGGPNTERLLYMERHSSLAPKDLVVSVEQVGIFLTNDNTVISFFENSADDIEPPIMARLASTNTLLRSACDASMVLQAILDAVIDLAFPIVYAYQDTIGELELNVLTEPSLRHTTALYILTSELSLLKTTLQPIVSVVNALRDHKRDSQQRFKSGDTLSSVEVSTIAHTYLGDVQDHCIMLLDYLDTMKRSADNLTDLIFNTMGNLQNESMRTLTLVTVLFLPMSFLTGYFGMNFTKFDAIENSETLVIAVDSQRYFWSIGAPIAAVVLVMLMFDKIKRFVILTYRKQQIKRVRRMRLAKAALEKAKLKRQTSAEHPRRSTASRRSRQSPSRGGTSTSRPSNSAGGADKDEPSTAKLQ